MKTEIHVHESVKKTWSEPQIVITRGDIISHENSQKANRERQINIENAARSQEPSQTTAEHSFDCRISSETLTKRLIDLRNSLLQSHIVRQQLQTPKKCVYGNNTSDSVSVTQSTVSNTLGQDFDWTIPQHSMSRSMPSSPLIGTIPHMTISPTILSNQESCFSFLPDRLRLLEETRHLPENTKLIMVSGYSRDVVIHLSVRMQLIVYKMAILLVIRACLSCI